MRTATCLALAATVLPLAAQAPPSTQMVMEKKPGMAAVAHSIKLSATVVAIEPATRTVTLKGPEGNILDVVADAKVKNFAQIKVGDVLVVDVVESLTLELKKTGSSVTEVHERENMKRAEPGQKPGGAAARQVTILANVVAMDTKGRTVSLKGPKGNVVILPVQSEETFKMVKVGDQVEAVYTEAVAISMKSAAAPAKKK